MNQVLESRPQTTAAAPKAAVSPARLAHVVFRTSQFDALVDWYTTVLCAKTAFSNGALAATVLGSVNGLQISRERLSLG